MKVGIGQQISNIRKIVYNAGVETALEYFDGGRVKAKVPSIKLVFAPFLAPFVPLELVSQDVGGIIQSCTFQKSRSMPYGSAHVTLLADDEMFASGLARHGIRTAMDVFHPMTLIQLWMDGYHVMTGYVRGIRKRTSVGKAKVYTVEIDELGGLLSQNIMDYITVAEGESKNTINDPYKLLAQGAYQTGGVLSLTIYTLLQAFIGSTLDYGRGGFFRMSDGLPLAFRIVALPAPLGGISLTSLMSQMLTESSMFSMASGTSFWDYLKGLVPTPYCEFFTESGGRTICTGRNFANLSLGDEPGQVAERIQGNSIDPTAYFGAGSALQRLANNPIVSGATVTPMLPGFSYIILRTSPYDNPMAGSSSWHPLLRPYTIDMFDLVMTGDFVIVSDDDVIDKDLGISDTQQFTIFDAPLHGQAGSGDAAMLHNRPSMSFGPYNPLSPGGVRTYGARVFRAPIGVASTNWGKLATQSIERLVRRTGQPPSGLSISSLSSLLNYWFRNAGKFREGSIVTTWKPYARPGMMLLYLPPQSGAKPDDPSDIAIYYVDNVTHSYQLGGTPTTTFSVIRGTPLPFNTSQLIRYLMDWEILPVGLNLSDGEGPATSPSDAQATAAKRPGIGGII